MASWTMNKSDIMTDMLVVPLLVIYLYLYTSPYSSSVLGNEVFLFWQVAVSFVLSLSVAIILVHALLLYGQSRAVNDLVLAGISFDVLIISFVYGFGEIVSLAGDAAFIPKANLISEVILAAVLTSVGFAMWLFLKDRVISAKTSIVSGLLGFLLIPIVCLLLIVLPVGDLSQVLGSIARLDVQGGVVAFIVVVSAFNIVFPARQWVQSRGKESTAVVFGSIFWLLGALFFAKPHGENAVAEVVGIASIATGYLVIAVWLITTSLFEPHRVLTRMIEDRTHELERSNLEIEYYLSMWSHEFGNSLQGIISYLEIISMTVSEDSSLRNLSLEAEILVRRTELILHVVRDLLRLRETSPDNLQQEPVAGSLSSAIAMTAYMVGEEACRVIVNSPDNTDVLRAPQVIEAAFLDLLLYLLNNIVPSNAQIGINMRIKRSSLDVEFDAPGQEMPQDVIDSLFQQYIPRSTAMGLDLFVVKKIIDRLGCRLEYSYDQRHMSNLFKIIVPIQ